VHGWDFTSWSWVNCWVWRASFGDMSTLACFIAIALAPVSETKSVDAAGLKWSYVWATPSGKAKGIIIALHGAGGSGPQFAADSRWVDKATNEGFAVALPTGQPALPSRPGNPKQNPNLWNSGELNSRGPRAKIDDFAFFDTMLKECTAEIGKVPVFVAGHSNGAAMTYKLAAHWPDRVKGIGMMAGDLKCDLGPKPKHVIPSLIYAGEKDPLLLWDGGTVDLPWGNVKRKTEPVLKIVGKWATWQGLPGTPKKSVLADGTVAYDFIGETEKNLVRLVMIPGQGHVWPGGRTGEFSTRKEGQDSGKVDATGELVKFFGEQLGN
jgi:polyhydroxybutyrate depolymerase